MSGCNGVGDGNNQDNNNNDDNAIIATMTAATTTMTTTTTMAEATVAAAMVVALATAMAGPLTTINLSNRNGGGCNWATALQQPFDGNGL